MSAQPSPPRSAAYAALSLPRNAAAEANALAQTPPPDPFLLEESKKLQQLKEALWQAFLASGTSAIPLPLVDLSLAYTGLLRLQLTMLSAGDHRKR